MSVFLLLLLIAAPFEYDQGGIHFAVEQPAGWVVDSCDPESLVTLSQRDGLATLSINLFEDLMWSNALDVFGESTQELLKIGYTLAGKSRLNKTELMQAAANDGARFHYIKRDGEMKEHVFLMAILRDNITLLLTLYLPSWRDDHDRLVDAHKIMAGFHFLERQNPHQDTLPSIPPLK